MYIISKKNFHLIFLLALAIFISIIIINRTQFYFKEHLFSFSSKELLNQILTYNELTSEQKHVFRINDQRCDQIHNNIRKSNLINDLGPKFRFYNEDDDQVCVFFILNNKQNINVDEYLNLIHENVINILNRHVKIFNDNFNNPTKIDDLLEEYLKEKKVDFHTIELLKEIFKNNNINKKINFKVKELIKNSNYINYINSYNYFGVLQFLVFALIIIIFVITFFLFKRISIKFQGE